MSAFHQAADFDFDFFFFFLRGGGGGGGGRVFTLDYHRDNTSRAVESVT